MSPEGAPETGSRLRVALTFDAEHPDRPRCPPDACSRILDALTAAGVRGTFFIQGRWAEAYPDLAARIAVDGHVVGMHSHYHARMTLLLGGGFLADIDDGTDAVVKATGIDPRPWFRCPFGDGHDDVRVLAELESCGYRNVHWDVEVRDWEPERNGATIAADVIAGVQAHGDGAIVLLHTWPGSVADGIGEMLDGLYAAGAEFVTLDELTSRS